MFREYLKKSERFCDRWHPAASTLLGRCGTPQTQVTTLESVGEDRIAADEMAWMRECDSRAEGRGFNWL
jgi:hypothetical protein